MAHGALKVSALYFRPVDYFKSYIFGINMKNVKNWCMIHLCRKENNLIALKMGSECEENVRRFPCSLSLVTINTQSQKLVLRRLQESESKNECQMVISFDNLF